MRTYHVAIVGATGAVGTEFLRLLETREFPLASLRLLASERSVGKTLLFRGKAANGGTADRRFVSRRGHRPFFGGRFAQ